ncbi:MAG: type II toxin-antitoxin system RelE/ParE family toxin [Pseudomonas sp.]
MTVSLPTLPKTHPSTRRALSSASCTRLHRLANFPESGRRVSEAKCDDIREVVFQSYRIIYRIIDAQRIDIIAVVHGRRDLSQAKNQPWAVG